MYRDNKSTPPQLSEMALKILLVLLCLLQYPKGLYSVEEFNFVDKAKQ